MPLNFPGLWQCLRYFFFLMASKALAITLRVTNRYSVKRPSIWACLVFYLTVKLHFREEDYRGEVLFPTYHINVKVKVTQSCPTLCNPMDYTVHEILQARTLEWVVFPFSRGSSQRRDQTQVSCIAGGFFTSWAIISNVYVSNDLSLILTLRTCLRYNLQDFCTVKLLFLLSVFLFETKSLSKTSE